MRRAPLSLVLALGLLPGVALAQAPQPKPHDLLKVAYALRRQGKYVQACVAFETLLRMLKRSPYKKPIALETADLYKVMGDERKALLLYRRNRDVDRELQTLLDWKGPKPNDRLNEALTVARLVKKPRYEALALVKLGKTDQGLKLLAANELHKDRADVLLGLKRYTEAAAEYFKASAFFEQGQALEQAGKTKEARRAYEDAAEKLKYRLKEETLPRRKRAVRAFKTAKNAVLREKARYDLAKAYGALATDFGRWAKCLSAAGDAKRAVGAASKALNLARRQKALLEDQGNQGGDVYGKQAAETLYDLTKRISALETALAQYRQALPPAKEQGK